MYESAIKRAGLSMNRIVFSNTKMVAQGFPALKEQQFRLSFKYRTFENGKTLTTKCKLVDFIGSSKNVALSMHLLFFVANFCLPFNVNIDFTAEDLDEVLPARGSTMQ